MSGPRLKAALEAGAFSGLLVATAAAALAAAAARALGLPPASPAALLFGGGALFFYNLDRLGDRERDAAIAPRRSAFVGRHRRLLALLAGLGLAGVLGAGVLAARAGAGGEAAAILVPVAALGFLHRGLKVFAWAKPLYLAAAWCACAAGLPAALAPEPAVGLPRVAGILFPVLLANALLCDLGDPASVAGRLGPGALRLLAGGLSAAALAAALGGAPAARPLAALPLALSFCLAVFRPAAETFGPLAADGALLSGAVAALLWPAG